LLPALINTPLERQPAMDCSWQLNAKRCQALFRARL
jgi:hypothetical protein